jgi:flagellar hook assembly protein FlgD
MSSRIFLIICGLFAMLAPGMAGAQADSPEKAAAAAGRPIIWRPADSDTVSSMWVNVEGAIPQEMLGKVRDIEVFVNAASRGKARLRGVIFQLEGVRLDCLVSGGWNSLMAVCTGPSLKVETDETKILLLPGQLEIDAEMSTDAISPARSGSAGGQNREVAMRFSFSTPADWTLKLTDVAGGKVIRGASGSGAASCEFKWNGTDVSGNVVPDGEYMYEVVAASTCGDAGNAHYAGVMTVDTSVPGKPEQVEPVNEDIVSPDFYLRWKPVAAAWYYEVQLSESADFDPHEIYSTGATQLRFSGRPDGFFNWRVRAVSRGGTAGPFSAVRRAEVRKVMKPAISMLGVTTKADGLVPDRGETMRVTYMANDDVLVTIRIVTPEGVVVRTLLNGIARDKGPHVELWDGRDDDNELVPAGGYVATIEAGGTEDVTAFSESRLVVVEY